MNNVMDDERKAVNQRTQDPLLVKNINLGQAALLKTVFNKINATNSKFSVKLVCMKIHNIDFKFSK